MNPYGISPPARVDLIALAAWNAANLKARRAYHAEATLTDLYAKRIAASEKQIRYQRRKKGDA